MATNFWIELSGNWFTAANWTDGVPAPGDTAIIYSGNPTITGTHALRGLTIDVGSETISSTAAVDFTNAHATLAWNSTLLTGAVAGRDPYGAYVGHVNLTGSTLTNNGAVLAVGDHAQMIVSLTSSTFTNNAFVGAIGSGTEIDFIGTTGTPNDVTNNGVMAAFGGTLNLDATVLGHGVIDVANNGHVTVNAGIRSGEFVALTSGMLEVTDPARMAFEASVGDLTAASTFQIDGGYGDAADRSVTISDVSQHSEILNLMANGQSLFSVKLNGHYSAADFHIGQVGSNALIAYDHQPPVYGI